MKRGAGGDPPLLVERVERRIRHDRRQRERRLGLDRVRDLAVARIDRNDLAAGIGEQQPLTRKHRTIPGHGALLLLLVVLEMPSL